MTVKVRERKYPNGTTHIEVDIHVRLLDGTMCRERRKSPVPSRQGAMRWAKEREAWLLRNGIAAAGTHAPMCEAPTLEEFAARFLAEHVKANRQRPSTYLHKETQLRAYILPVLGRVRIDALSDAEIARLKAHHEGLAASTLNNMLALVRLMLRTAKSWGVIEKLPCEARPVKAPPGTTAFYTPDEYERLVDAARGLGTHVLVMVLLGGDAGLRAGEMLALRWANIDLNLGRLTVAENTWHEHIGPPKGGRVRHVPLTPRIIETLRSITHSGDRVLWRPDHPGTEVTKRCLDGWLHSAQRAAGFPSKGPHILRHTFCSRLAARGAPARAIQGLAGHSSSRTTDRYMHLAPQVLDSAIKLLI